MDFQLFLIEFELISVHVQLIGCDSLSFHLDFHIILIDSLMILIDV